MRWMAMSVVLATWVAGAAGAEPFKKPLISTRSNIEVVAWEAKSKDVTPQCPTSWSVRKSVLHGGRQEGVDVIVLDNGKLQITILPTRGMGVLAVTLGDVRLGWDSPIKDVVHPKFINLPSRGGLGWLEGFNEWLCRCGLESNGLPGTDKFINNQGDEKTMELTLHGKIANIPAEAVEFSVDREPPYRLYVKGRVAEKTFHGPKFELETVISTEPGTSTFRIADKITNTGGTPQEFEILYHVNQGKPILESGSTFAGPVRQVTPFNDHAAKSVATYTAYGPPQPGFVEQVYCLRLLGDSQDHTVVMLRNRARDRAMSLAFSIKEVPCLTLWKNTAAVADGYVTGLEPGTNFPNNRRMERQLGRVPTLAAGASHRAIIDYGIHVGVEDVKRVADRIAGIQGERQPTIDDKPAKAD